MRKGDQHLEDASVRADLIFCDALEIGDAAERTRFIETACAGESAVRREVELLFASLIESDEFFEAGSPARISAVEISQTLADIPDFFEQMKAVLPDDDEVGKQIGPYKLLQKIGEGGVGNVYLAEQLKPVRRQVALKVIKLGMDTKSVIARFEAERQALAMMEHPNIAHVLNAGETETGRPFFVMELVHGDRITTYCEENRLTIRQRLELLVQVLHAIQHAHQKGIIHRDIKPSNVLITRHTGVPMPLVIDFGIAKATHGDLLTDRTAYTSVESLVGTPAYMSPEQAQTSGMDVDTRSDIYSLGVLLYELLDGGPPFHQKELLKAGLEGMRRMLLEREPLRPSVKLHRLMPAEQTRLARGRGTDPRRLEAMLNGDLDWIVMKALEKDRTRRYETADAFAMDIERFLNDEPVLARPPSRRYRFKKLVRRNRGVFAAVGAVSAALVIGLAVSSVLFVKERSARHRAVTAEHLAEEALANEARLRLQAERRETITQAAFALSRNQFEEAERLIDAVELKQPTIESASVLRQLGAWHALRGDREQAVLRYRQLLTVNRLDDRETQGRDFMAGAAVVAEFEDAAGFTWLRREMGTRLGGSMPSQAAARMLMGALLLPADEPALEALQPLVHLVVPPFSTQEAVRPGVVQEEDEWQRLVLEPCGMNTPHQLTHENGVVTFEAGGENIWDQRDSFEFANRTISGDFDFRLRVRSIRELDQYTRVGLMVRSDITNPGARHIMVAVNAENTFQVLVRSRDGATTASLPPNPLPQAWGSNSWVRLQRVGSAFRGYSSDNGRDWMLLDTYDSAIGSAGPLADTVRVGIAACAHSAQGTTSAVLSDFGVPSIRSVDAMLAAALMEYRRGNLRACADICQSCLPHPDLNASRAPILRTLFALSYHHLGQVDSARTQLDQARKMIKNKFSRPLDTGSETQGYWFDWIAARVLLHEAETIHP